jgi:serine/threonine protein kinase
VQPNRPGIIGRTIVQEVQGKGYLSKAADMYSLGVLLWEMFHGMPPYAADNGHLVNNNSFPRFDLRHREDAPFSYVVVSLACLSDDYEKRYDFAYSLQIHVIHDNVISRVCGQKSAVHFVCIACTLIYLMHEMAAPFGTCLQC